MKEFDRISQNYFNYLWCVSESFCGERISREKASLGVSKELFFLVHKMCQQRERKRRKNTFDKNYPRNVDVLVRKSSESLILKIEFFTRKASRYTDICVKWRTVWGEIFGGFFCYITKIHKHKSKQRKFMNGICNVLYRML